MNSLEFRQQWADFGGGDAEFSKTQARIEIHAGGYNLTENENTWSQSIQDHILVSAYPLAMWILQSWWRLLYEPLPSSGRPNTQWRMAHELGAANHGFVWPTVLFASDGENLQVWAMPSDANSRQSARYINGLYTPVAIPVAQFRVTLEAFVSTVVNRLAAVGLPATDLGELFKIIQHEQQDQDSALYRKLEALMGFDPDECPQEAMDHAIQLSLSHGIETLWELAPVFGRSHNGDLLQPFEAIQNAPGISGKPSLPPLAREARPDQEHTPWQMAVEDARDIRRQIGNPSDPLETESLLDLLGVSRRDGENWAAGSRMGASVGVPTGNQGYKFISRKRHPVSQRFELARYIGDHRHSAPDQWLANTDLGTARQKYQRAFAAEFLCPIDGLADFLDDDYSEDAIEDAAEHYNVSDQTIRSLLANNHYIERPGEGVPYWLGVRG